MTQNSSPTAEEVQNDFSQSSQPLPEERTPVDQSVERMLLLQSQINGLKTDKNRTEDSHYSALSAVEQFKDKSFGRKLEGAVKTLQIGIVGTAEMMTLAMSEKQSRGMQKAVKVLNAGVQGIGMLIKLLDVNRDGNKLADKKSMFDRTGNDLKTQNKDIDELKAELKSLEKTFGDKAKTGDTGLGGEEGEKAKNDATAAAPTVKVPGSRFQI